MSVYAVSPLSEVILPDLLVTVYFGALQKKPPEVHNTVKHYPDNLGSRGRPNINA